MKTLSARLFVAAFVTFSLLAQNVAAFGAETATQALIDAQMTEQTLRINAYVNTGYALSIADALLTLVVAAAGMALGWSRRWRAFAERKFNAQFAQVLIYFAIYAVVFSLLMFPLGWYADFYTEHQHGLATQSFTAWLTEQLIGGAVTIPLMAVFVGILYAVIRRAPNY